MKVHAQPRPLAGKLPGGRAEATVVVEPLTVGTADVPEALVADAGGRMQNLRLAGVGSNRRRVPCPAFLIHHPSAGPFLVDTGLHPSVSADPTANLGRAVARYAHPDLPPGTDLPAQLRARGLDAKQIRLVLMTHLHIDHSSGISEFPAATFVISEAEWDAATMDSRPLMRGYRPAHYDYAFDYRTLSYDRPEVSSYSSFARTFDLFGDGSVRLAHTPGHTAGHQSVICRLRDRDLVIAGDALTRLDQLDGEPLAPRPFDPHLQRRSLQELRLFRSQYPHAVIIPGHDADVWPTLDKRYE